MRLPSWTPCFSNPDEFDCSDCEIGWDACRLRVDEALRHFHAARWRSRDGGSGAEPARADFLEQSAIAVARERGLPLPVTLLWQLLPASARVGVREDDLRAILRTSANFTQSSPGMFRWNTTSDLPEREHSDWSFDVT